MKQIDYLAIYNDVMKFMETTHLAVLDGKMGIYQYGYCADDLIDGAYHEYFIIDDNNLSAGHYTTAVAALHCIIRIFGRNALMRDQDYLNPIRLNAEKYRSISEHLTEESTGLFNDHLSEVRSFFNL